MSAADRKPAGDDVDYASTAIVNKGSAKYVPQKREQHTPPCAWPGPPSNQQLSSGLLRGSLTLPFAIAICHAIPAHALLLSLTKHVDEEEFGDIPVAELDVFLLESRPDACTLLGHDPSLLGRGLARPHRPDQLTQLDGHVSARSVSFASRRTRPCAGFATGAECTEGGLLLCAGRKKLGVGSSCLCAFEARRADGPRKTPGANLPTEYQSFKASFSPSPPLLSADERFGAPWLFIYTPPLRTLIFFSAGTCDISYLDGSVGPFFFNNGFFVLVVDDPTSASVPGINVEETDRVD